MQIKNSPSPDNSISETSRSDNVVAEDSNQSNNFPVSDIDNDDNSGISRENWNMEPLTPLVEWIYPEFESVHEINIQPIPQEESTTDGIPSTIIIDPSQTTVIPIIDGEIVPSRRCYIKIYGLRICDDNFATKVNPWILIIALIIALTAGLTGGLLHSSSEAKPNNLTLTTSPSHVPSMAPSFNPRTMNITGILLSVSGGVMMDTGSPQNRALIWILYQDGMNLSHESPNLVQRYAMMVFYYSMSGEEWRNNDGYGTDKHECDFYGVECVSSSKVIKIDLNQNNLVGKIPQEIGSLRRLIELKCSFNRISGGIPSSIGALTKLQFLRISGNTLSGTLPDEMKNCRSLAVINIATNMLIGTIPSSLSSLRVLTTLRLSTNKLTGTIPSSFDNLNNLVQLSLHQNMITGEISETLCDFPSISITADCLGLAPEVSCSCCIQCY